MHETCYTSQGDKMYTELQSEDLTRGNLLGNLIVKRIKVKCTLK